MNTPHEPQLAHITPSLYPLGTAPSWSGKSIEHLTDDDIRAMCAFAEQSGWDAGRADAVADVRPLTPSNLFHRDLLGGVPHLLWDMAYRRGTFDAERFALKQPLRPCLSLVETREAA